MKNLLLTFALILPGLTFAGGAGNTQYADLYERAKSAQESNASEGKENATPTQKVESAENTDFGSTEDPTNILESRAVTGSNNENYMKYSYSFISSTYWDSKKGITNDNINGFIELEEYFGQTDRQDFVTQADVSRERERQQRARAKALRLQSLYR